MAHRPEIRLAAVSALMNLAVERGGRAFDAMRLKASDGYPTQVIGASPPTGPGSPTVRSDDECATLTGVEAVVIHRWKTDADWKALTHKMEVIGAAVYSFLDLASKLTETPAQLICTNGKGREGAAEWGRTPPCGDGGEPRFGGMCSACYQRERRWRVKAGLPTRHQTQP